MGKVLRTYARLLFCKWWTLMSCAIWTVIAFYDALANKPNIWLVRAMGLSALFCLLWAGFLVWKEERIALQETTARIEVHRPRLHLTVAETSTARWRNDQPLFVLRHLGGEAAQFVSIKPLRSISRDYLSIRFDPVDFIDSPHNDKLIHGILVGLDGRDFPVRRELGNLLFVFFRKEPKGESQYPIEIHFKWGANVSEVQYFTLHWDSRVETLRIAPLSSG